MKKKVITGILVFLGLIVQAVGMPAARAATNLPIYTDALASGWENWSWDTTINFNNTSPVQAGARSISAQFSAAWAGLYFHPSAEINLADYDRLRFWIHGGSAGGQRMIVAANQSASGANITAQAGQWKEVVIPLSDLGSPATLTDLWWHDTTGGAQPVFYIDQIELLARSGGTTPEPPPGTGPALTVNVAAGRRAISPYIYGMNFADPALANELDLPVNRRGGNSTTRYNWMIDAYNTGSDWYFENIAEDNDNPAALPDGSAADRFVEQNRANGTDSIITVPLIGWVAKSRKEQHPYDCGFNVNKYGAQQKVDPWDTACGNGINTSGANITGNNPTDTSIAVDPQFVRNWVNHLKDRYGAASASGVQFYNLDNEPMLWNSTHRDVHPNPTTYDEMRKLTIDYAAVIKQADPSAQTLGPVLWGWCAYFYSAKDDCGENTGPGSDYDTYDAFFVPWYLQQMQAYQTDHGVRILDYLDLHYYPQAEGVSLADSPGDAATQALRLRSTRALWDPTYIDESWISDGGGVAVNLIGRMKGWVSANYPGTRLAITEYNWGALGYLNGTLAQADVLGIFGREGLDLATIWGPPKPNQPGAYAFRMFRNYDGQGGKFGEISVQAASADQGKLAVYAAQRSDQAVTILVINKTGGGLTSTLNLSGFTPLKSAQVYRYSGDNLGAIVRAPGQAVSSTGFSATYPANSITLFVIPLNVPTNERLYITQVKR